VSHLGRFGTDLPFDKLRVDGSKVARFDKLDCKKRRKNGEKLVFFVIFCNFFVKSAHFLSFFAQSLHFL
jgi:hypothetical protein